MKKIFLSAALVSLSFVFAQKKEIAAAFKAADAGDYSTASSQISAADVALGDKTYLLDPETLEQYYYAKGLSLLKSGKVAEGASYLSKITDLGKSKIYTGKDANKTRVYYVGKAAADASGIQNLKEETYTLTTSGKIGGAINNDLQEANKKAMDAYNAKNFAVAGEKFLLVYDLLKASGQDNKRYLYYSAATYSQSDKKAEALSEYQELIDSGYTGVETTYTAKNKKTGETEPLDKTAYELYQKMGAAGDYSDFKTETSKSIEEDLYTEYADMLIRAEKYDQALLLIEKGMKKFPGNSKLTDLQGTAYYRSGKTDQFIATLKSNVAKNPNDYESWYNLGVLTSKETGKDQEALGYFDKALLANPKYIMALRNATYLTMGDDEKTVNDMETARKSGKMDIFNKLLTERKARFVKAIPYAEKWYDADSNNIEVVSLLKGLYTSAQNPTKVAEFKAKEQALKDKK